MALFQPVMKNFAAAPQIPQYCRTHAARLNLLASSLNTRLFFEYLAFFLVTHSLFPLHTLAFFQIKPYDVHVRY